MENYFQRFVNNLESNKERDAGGGGAANTATRHDELTAPAHPGDVAARLAVYDTLRAAPRIIELNAGDYGDFIDVLATKTYQSAKEIGGNIPYTVLREIIENLIHAYFKEIVISIFDNGNTVRISDQGPGIKHKDKAFEPGFSTASSNMKSFIKGVGSGLPIAKEALSFLGGAISIEDNLEKGTVITLKVPGEASGRPAEQRQGGGAPLDLNKRQKQILFLAMEIGSIGPSKIAGELGVSLSTAYRDLIYLEEKGLISADEQGKRVLTQVGVEILDDILNL